jgi:SAM-dependent methyltransferase
MDEARFLKPSYPVDAFATTVDDYVLYRVPYPAALTQDLLARTGANGSGRLLDLACGPGRASLPLAGSFREIWAIDLEPRMVAAGRRLAAERAISNVRWFVGRAEDLEAPPASFDLITVGEAFHRLDQKLIAAKCLHWLKPGGCIATMGSYTLLGGTAPWQRVISGVAHKWTGHDFPAIPPWQAETETGPGHDERALLAAGFVDVASYPFLEPFNWTIESIIGFLFSTSICSRKVLGPDADAFVADLRSALLAHDPRGSHPDTIRFGYTLARKPPQAD